MIVVFIILALAVSAVFHLAELALSTIRESRIRTLVEEGFRGSTALERLQSESEHVVVLLRLGQIGGAVIAAGLAGWLGSRWGPGGGLAAIGVVGLIWLIFCQLVPVRLAVARGVRISLMSAVLLWPAWRLARPFVSWLAGGLPAQPAREDEAGSRFTESELRQVTALGRTEGLIEEHEGRLVERAFRLDEMRAWDVMTPRVDIFAWRDSITLGEIAGQLSEVRYSRVPVYGDSVDDITGVLYLRDAYQALIAGESGRMLGEVAREPLAVPGSLRLTRLLREFQTRRVHLAVVLDEYGGTDGLVTLEDVIEELVGEIVDETDVEHEPILRLSDAEIVADGDAELREINELLQTKLPQSEHRSLNGYLLEELGRVPAVGERVEANGLVVEVLEATEVQVLRAKLMLRDAESGSGVASGDKAAARSAADVGDDPETGLTAWADGQSERST